MSAYDVPVTYPYSHKDLFGGRYSEELFWVYHQPWLEQQGYSLRPRFHPDWVPSWLGTDIWPLDTDDGVPIHVSSSLRLYSQLKLHLPYRYTTLPTPQELQTAESLLSKR